MNKQVLLSIQGLHFTDSDDDDTAPVEVITPAEYYHRNGKHYIVYDEVSEDRSGNTKTRIKIGDNQVEITKKGAAATNMHFEKGKKHLTCYATPYGELMLGIFTNSIHLEEHEAELSLQIEYILEANYEPISECSLSLHITEDASTLFESENETL